MRIGLLIDETFFFHPKYVSDLCLKYKKKIKVAFLVTKIKKKNSIQKYIYRNFYRLNLEEIITLGFITLSKIFREFLYTKFNIGKPQTVFSTLKKNGIKVIKVDYNFNNEKNYQEIIDKNLNLIISSNSLIIGEKILNIENLNFINRHSSYLPYNAGIWPTFYSISNQQNFTGATIHLMNSGIDTGKILTQKKIIIKSKNLFDLYKECFHVSSDLTFKAIEKIKDFKTHEKNKILNKVIYNSFPKKIDWKNFRKNKGSFAKFHNLFF
jgi:methionyl-tRNA formyltransferase